jgi:hypothetical protein
LRYAFSAFAFRLKNNHFIYDESEEDRYADGNKIGQKQGKQKVFPQQIKQQHIDYGGTDSEKNISNQLVVF